MMSSFLKNRFLQNYFWIALAEISSKGINIILPIIIANFFGLEIFGLYSFALSISILFLLFSDLGLTQLFVREVAKNKDEKNIEKLFILFFCIKVVLSLICIGALIGVYIFFPSDSTLLVCMLSGVYIVNSFIEFIRGIYRGKEKSSGEAAIRLIYSFLIIGVLYPILLLSKISILEFSALFLFLHNM